MNFYRPRNMKDGYEPKDELEVYITSVAQHQLYTTQRPKVQPVLYPDQIETYAAQDSQIGKTTAARCYIKIGNNSILAVLDSDITVSIMSNKMIKKLDLKIIKPSTTMVANANRARVRALGKVVNVNENSLIKLEDNENKGTFDKFKFEDELLEEAKEYFTYKTSKIKCLETPKKNKLDGEKDIFAYNMNNLSQTNMLVHKIDTGNAVPIKQTPYRAAPSV
ncbi:22976_t:CDS:2 [Cetraspora pellucida]|uniref:22976_t:CDS:1 n=1 Tax=Cetraspora pellucida TaxID=1433469 RepID=A0A9N8VVC9_9GLOM|nr:22976_t:CDS:2 [Cetraspora pellucida]